MVQLLTAGNSLLESDPGIRRLQAYYTSYHTLLQYHSEQACIGMTYDHRCSVHHRGGQARSNQIMWMLSTLV